VPRRQVLFRRSPHVVCYWSKGDLVFHNYATGKRVAGNALTIGLLDYFTDWRDANALIRQATLPAARLRRAILELARSSVLQQSDKPTPAESSMEAWNEWNPEAGFFHFSTKDAPYGEWARDELAFVKSRLPFRPTAPSSKTLRRTGRSMLALPPGRRRTPFDRVLLDRRTWRRFGSNPISILDVATLLDLTFGAQRQLDLGQAGRAMLRTSPSAGACHPIEAYLVARNVAGMAPGIYQYCAGEHGLRRVGRVTRSTIQRHLPGQSWYRDASLLVLLTAVFNRVGWKYPFPRAYRAVLLEAGHLCQTFCLVATSLRLAPFCTMALADTVIERDLRIDGVSESVLYACGVGPRPGVANWSPEMALLEGAGELRPRARTR
jgi:SagB-type dehydrogenase family enzyme